MNSKNKHCKTMATKRNMSRTRTTIEQAETEKEIMALYTFFSCASPTAIPSLVADGLLEMNEEAIYSEGASSSSRSTTGSGSGKEVEDAIPPTSLPRLYSVDQEIGGPPPALKVRLMREKHVHYLINGLGSLGPSYVCLDASRPWIIYWITNSLDILDALHPSETAFVPSPSSKDGSEAAGTAASAAADSSSSSSSSNSSSSSSSSSSSYSSSLRTARHLRKRIVSSLKACQSPTGGFGGGNQQLSHCAPTYAAVLALVAVGGAGGSAGSGGGGDTGSGSSSASANGSGEKNAEKDEEEDVEVQKLAYGAIDRPALYSWMLSLKDAHSGGFRLHDDGEVDVRGTYTVVAVAYLLNLLTPQLMVGVAEFALGCQTYEGGFGGEPGAEAHGGYAFCAVAALALLNQAQRCDVPSLERWLAGRQLLKEGGFAGRTNKLVDGCYSFWQGATCAILEHLEVDPHCCGFSGSGGAATSASDSSASAAAAAPSSGGGAPGAAAAAASVVGQDQGLGVRLFNAEALQRYTLMCAQQFPDGGLRDKPSKPRDFYHSCYNLGGLSVSQHAATGGGSASDGAGSAAAGAKGEAGNVMSSSSSPSSSPLVWGSESNLVAVVHPAFNVRASAVAAARAHFVKAVCNHDTLLADYYDQRRREEEA